VTTLPSAWPSPGVSGPFSGSWWASIFPGLALMLLVACINIVADWLRDALEPRSKEQV